MEHKVLLSVAVTFILFQYAHSLRCYTCNSKDPDRSCASPLDRSKVISEECNKTTLYNNSPFGSDVDQMLKSTGSSAEFQCIAYEKFYFYDNTTQTTRRCMQKYDSFCAYLNETAQAERSHNLTRCHICNTENCNSSTSLRISVVSCIFGLILGSTFK